MGMVEGIVGILPVLVGLALILIKIAVWLGLLGVRTTMMVAEANQWDVLLALIKKLPPLFIVGPLLIYADLKLLEVPLPF
jgi:hypothetical protein